MLGLFIIAILGLSNGQTYVATTTGGTWAEMKAYCENEGMQLATFDDAEDLAAISAACELSAYDHCYLGFEDFDGDGNLHFVDGVVFTDADYAGLWSPGEPHNGGGGPTGHSCGCIWDIPGRGLADCYCTGFSLLGVCEITDGCTTSAEYNVQIIIDESGSVNFNGIDGFGLSIDFVKELIANQLSPDAPLSVFTFGTGNNPDIETVYQFEDDQSSRGPVLTALDNVDFDSGGTPTREAIQQGIAEFQAGIAGGHLNDGERLLFLLTDGVPTTGSPCDLKAQLDALEIRVIVLGVGSQWNRDNVECLAEDADIHLIGGFSEDNFDDLIDEISETICPPEDGCVTTTEYDVQFLIDESGSVPRSGYELSIDFIQSLILNDISADAKVSVFEFGTNVQIIYGFDDLQQPRTNMIQVIEDADYDSGGTRTGDAVQAGINEWERAEAAGELSGGEKLLFILTDGRPNGGVDPCSLKDDLDALGVTVIIIGVGTFDRTRVDCLAVNAGDSVIEVAAFTEEAFDAVEAAISEETCPDDEIIVPEDPLPCREAQEYCKNTYGTNLATIITDDDRAAAQAALNGASEPFGFIGLHSDDIETKWQFRSGAECPSASAYRCVDFWRTAPGGFNNRPRCIGDGEGGFGCAVIYADDGTVDNDILDTAPFPFLCDGA